MIMNNIISPIFINKESFNEDRDSKEDNFLHICYALNDGYSGYCSVSIISILVNNHYPFHFHLLTDGISKENSALLQQIVSKYNSKLSVHIVDDSYLKGQKETWTKYAWYRLFTPNFLNKKIETLLYLDVDTIIDCDISELFHLDLSNKSLAAVPDIMTIYDDTFKRVNYDKNKGYFCSGVLLMNLNYFRENDLSANILKFALENPERINFPDQDALNFICQDSKMNLPLKYDILPPFFTDKNFMAKYKDEVKEALHNPFIIHYAGCNPWKYEINPHYFESKFWEYAKLSPFKVKKTHICKGLPLLKLRTKKLLGYLGIPNFRKYKKKSKPKYKDIINFLNSLG